ncbi:MAG: thioredoxin domain-containing protein, partial [Saprospiraceae bacterium]|nr:thioredoxin domain-containing protein [Saprospiraceae bacterium]
HLELVESLSRGVDVISGLPYIGEADAPVTRLIYEDVGCPHCKDYFQRTESQVLSEFVAAGDVRVMVYTMAIVNAQSLPGAEGAYCALDQDMFWEFRDLLFNNQGVRQFNRQNLITFAEELGLDVDAFTLCFDLGTHTQEIISRSQRAFDFGITGTPTTEINGQRYSGVIEFAPDDGSSGLRTYLETALEAAGE